MKNLFSRSILYALVAFSTIFNFVFAEEFENSVLTSTEALVKKLEDAERRLEEDFQQEKIRTRELILIESFLDALKIEPLRTSLIDHSRGNIPVDLELLNAVNRQGLNLFAPNFNMYQDNAPVCYAISVAYQASNGPELIDFIVNLVPNYLEITCSSRRSRNNLREYIHFVNDSWSNENTDGLLEKFKIPVLIDSFTFFTSITKADSDTLEIILNSEFDITSQSKSYFNRYGVKLNSNAFHQLARCKSTSDTSCKAIAERLIAAYKSKNLDLKTSLDELAFDSTQRVFNRFSPGFLVLEQAFNINRSNSPVNIYIEHLDYDQIEVLGLLLDNGAMVGDGMMRYYDKAVENCEKYEENNKCSEVLKKLGEKLITRYFATVEEIEKAKAEKKKLCGNTPWRCKN